MNKEELEAQISYYSSKYYAGEPEISDEQFDALVDRLRQLDPSSKVLKTGWGFEVVGDKVKHKYSHIGSLDKTKTYSEIPNRFINKTIFISPKLDGLSAVAYYINGELIKGVTRGDGNYGKDITAKLKIILGNSIPDKSFTGAVRGELIIHNENWNVLRGKYNNLIAPRNFVAGIINRNEIDEDLAFVDLVVYKIVGQENRPLRKRRDDILKWLAINFEHTIPEYYYPVLNEASWEAFHEQTYEQFKTLGYGLDGLVLTNSDVLFVENTNGYVYDEVAFKFRAESDETTIKEIEWTLSRTQRLIPVAVVEPVELSGAIINRATCNNAQMVRDMQLGKGARIEIMRANEVIPFIVNVISPSSDTLPTVCPCCGNSLVWDGVDLKCNNMECPNIAMSDLQLWCETVGETDGLQWTLMKQYLDNYGVTTIDLLYEKKDFIMEDLNSKKLSITELKVKEFFEKLYFGDMSVEKVLVGLNVPRLGEKTAKVLSSKRDLLYNLLLMSLGQLSINDDWTRQYCLELVKDASTRTIFENINKFKTLIYTYTDSNYSSSRLVFAEENLGITKFVAVTGALQKMKRKDFEAYIGEYGYGLTSNLKKCQYLITNDPTSGSAKNKQAREYGIEIITEENFLNLLNQNDN